MLIAMIFFSFKSKEKRQFLKLFKNSIDYDYKKLDCSEEKEKKESDDSLFSIN